MARQLTVVLTAVSYTHLDVYKRQANGSVILSPGNSPGNSLGTLTFSNGLTLASGGAISFHLFDVNGPAGVGYSEISATGGLTLTAAPNSLTFNLISVDANGLSLIHI